MHLFIALKKIRILNKNYLKQCFSQMAITVATRFKYFNCYFLISSCQMANCDILLLALNTDALNYNAKYFVSLGEKDDFSLQRFYKNYSH